MRSFNVLYDSEYKNYKLIRRTSKRQGYHKEILDRALDLTEYMTSKRKRTYGILLTFNFPEDIEYPENNNIFLKFREKFVDYFEEENLTPKRKTLLNPEKKKKRKVDVSYLWVLEKGEDAENIHYHVMFLFDGYEVTSMYYHAQALTHLWAKSLGIKDASGLVHYKGAGKFLDKDRSDYDKKYNGLVKWSSYLGKKRDKLNISGIRNWGSSANG